tara:strand:- start:1928 stop:2362 length:435 start_codon:yes stop_codon:yes gene_type:complete
MPSSQRNVSYWVERDAIAIIVRSIGNTSTTYNSPSEVKTVTIFAVKKPNKFISADTGVSNTTTGYNQEPDISEEFRHAVVAKAIQRGYELNPTTLQAASYWERQYDLGVREGKRYANTGRVQKAVIKLQGFEPTVHSTRDKDEG